MLHLYQNCTTLFAQVQEFDPCKFLSAGFENSLAAAAGTGGIRVAVQQPDTIANPSLEGFDIPSGISATIGLVASEIKRLPFPYGNCTSKNMELELLMQSIKRDLPGAPMRGHEVAKNSYRIADCRATCLQRYIIYCDMPSPSRVYVL